MINKLLYILILAWVKIHSLLPMRVLYLLGYVLYVLIYRIVRYRVKVVRQNLKNSFPDQTDAERRRIERRFYHHLADYAMETIKLGGISKDELMSRARLTNPEVIDALYDRGETCCLLLMGHYGNWEWLTASTYFFRTPLTIYQIYKPLKNKPFDRLFITLRTRFKGQVLKKNDVGREVIRLKRDKALSLMIFIADQTPSPANIHYRTNFLNQDTPMFTGVERLATKLNLPVVFADVRQVSRGRYEVDFEMIADKPSELPEYTVTERYARLMERTVMRDPAYWFWSHKRWKYARK